jgi:precorrin-6y C5,15-methyltransferase (decarboxylating) CbiE subunit
MAVNDTKITIVGCGPGAKEFVTPAASAAAAGADVLLGAQRLLDLFDNCPGLRIAWHGKTDDLLAELAMWIDRGKRAAVLVSGDPGIFSFARQIVQRFGPANCLIIPAVSSVQVAFARLHLAWVDARIISAHARTPDVEPAELAKWDKVAILAGSDEAIAYCGRVAQTLRETHYAYVCENLTLADESVRRVEAEALAQSGAPSLSIVLLIRRELIA